MTEIELKVDKGVKHLSNWQGMNNIPHGRVLLNKAITGCGATTFYLGNEENVILCSPRVALLQCKLKDDNIKKELFYYDSNNRDRDLNCLEYINTHPIRKIMVTYDSFSSLMNLITSNYGFGFANSHRIVVDEYQEMFNDAHFKAMTELAFVKEVFKFNDLLFVTATPVLEKYLYAIPEFGLVEYQVRLEFHPDDMEIVNPVSIRMKSEMAAFKQVMTRYKQTGCFDMIQSMDGSGIQYRSTEAVFFLNNVSTICSILKKYKADLKGKVNIICADTKTNENKLNKVGFSIGSVPGKDEQPKTFTFVTRTAFAGIDMYSDNASIFVFANMKNESMLIDVSLDLRQIAGRMRNALNRFRNKITVFYKEDSNQMDDKKFMDMQKQKTSMTDMYLQKVNIDPTDIITRQAIYDRVRIENREFLMDNEARMTYLDLDENGAPIFNIFKKVAEQRQWEMSKYRGMPVLVAKGLRSNICMQDFIDKFRKDMYNANSDIRERMKVICDYYEHCPIEKKEEFCNVISYYGESRLAYYIDKLGVERVRANGYNISKLNNEILNNDHELQIGFMVRDRFMSGITYTRVEVKQMLQSIYDELGLQKKAVATQIVDYIKCSRDKYKNYRIE